MRPWYDIYYWERTYLDLWSIPHTFFGVVLAFLFLYHKKSFKFGLTVTIVGAILWEFIEIYFAVSELFSNKFMDIVVATVGYLCVWLSLKTKDISDNKLGNMTLIAEGIFMLLIITGWIAFIHYAK